MAKKIDEIKAEQGFQKVGPTCSNCKHFQIKWTTKKYKMRTISGEFEEREYHVESCLRCGIGGFKAGKSNWCPRHGWKGADKSENA